MKTLKIQIVALIALVLFSIFMFSPLNVRADQCGDPTLVYNNGLCLPISTQTGTSPTSINSLAIVIINILLSIAFLTAVVFIVLGGFYYITSAGNEKRAESGKSMIVNALIGIVFIIMAYVIVAVVANTASCVGGSLMCYVFGLP